MTERVVGRSMVWTILGTAVPAVMDLQASRWFGAGDLHGLALYSLPFTGLIAMVAFALGPASRRNPRWLVVAACGTAGAILGVGWTMLNRWLLGPWFGAWSLPVLLCWSMGGALGLAAA